jgi:hypothetical protein
MHRTTGSSNLHLSLLRALPVVLALRSHSCGPSCVLAVGTWAYACVAHAGTIM